MNNDINKERYTHIAKIIIDYHKELNDIEIKEEFNDLFIATDIDERVYRYLVNKANGKPKFIGYKIEDIERIIQKFEVKKPYNPELYIIVGSLFYVKYLLTRHEDWQMVDAINYQILNAKTTHPGDANYLHELCLKLETYKSRAAVDGSAEPIHDETYINEKYLEWIKNREQLLQDSANCLFQAYENIVLAAKSGNQKAKILLSYIQHEYHSILKNYATRDDQFLELFLNGFFSLELDYEDVNYVFKKDGWVSDGAFWYLDRDFKRIGDSIEAIEYCKRAAEKNNVQAQYWMGIIYLMGLFTHQSLNQSINYLELAVAQGHTDAMILLSCIYLAGQGIPKDKERANNLLQAASNLGNKKAELYIKDYIVEDEEFGALSFSNCNISCKFSELSPFFQDIDRLVEAALSNGSGAIDAALLLSKRVGSFNYYWIFWKYTALRNNAVLDPRSAGYFFNSFLFKDDKYALDLCYRGQNLIKPGNTTYTPQYDYDTHVKRFLTLYDRIKRTIDNSYYGYYLMSSYYDAARENLTLEENIKMEQLKTEHIGFNKKILYYYMGYLQNDPHMTFNLALNQKFSTYFCRKAAEMGLAKAQNALAYNYQTGKKGLSKNLPQAFYWYKKSAEQGNPVAQFQIGMMYREGKGVEENLELSDYWINKAAEQNYYGNNIE